MLVASLYGNCLACFVYFPLCISEWNGLNIIPAQNNVNGTIFGHEKVCVV